MANRKETLSVIAIGAFALLTACSGKTAAPVHSPTPLTGALAQGLIAYVADGREDVPILKAVGLPIAVADAHRSALEVAKYVTRARGGDHALEEVVDLIMEARGWAT